MDSKRLILAMAPIEVVLTSFQREEIYTVLPAEDDSSTITEQDRFAVLINNCWTDLGPSCRYMKALIRTYASKLERAGFPLESDGLMDLVLRASIAQEGAPTPEDSCHLAFRLPPEDESRPWLRIKIYPYHNDVALRLWEAGAGLAEYFIENPDLVRGKHVVELGAGVGLTGLVIAGCCEARSVHMTDYTEGCRVNLAYNISINQDWLRKASKDCPSVTQGYLEWSSFSNSFTGTTDCKSQIKSSDCESQIKSSETFFDGIDVLVAADVVYDVAYLEHLVIVVRCFLQNAPSSRQAIFGITRRNMKTFDTFLGLLKRQGITCEWKGEGGMSLPLLFPCNFNQDRADIRFAHLSMPSIT